MKILRKAKLDKINAGDLVIVRSFAEILVSLDRSGALEGLAFLPEMVRYCGRTLLVQRRVNVLMQEGSGAGLRRIRNVVILESTVCDGRAHGDCQRSCFPLWKTAWLKPAPAACENVDSESVTYNSAAGFEEAYHRGGKGCQVTELIGATTPLPIWHPLRHYLSIASRTYSPMEYLSYLTGGIYRRVIRRFLNKLAKAKTVPSSLTPPERLDLKRGQLVKVKSALEIQATLNAEGKCRGLFFMPGMWAYCGRKLRVLQTVDRILSEKTGETRSLDQTFILEGATCDGKAKGGCQRGCYVFWKSAWLRLINEEVDEKA